MSFHLAFAVLFSYNWTWVVLGLLVSMKLFSGYQKSAEVPGLGYWSIPLLGSWKGAYLFTRNGKKMMVEGYRKYKSSYFKISTLRSEYIVVSSPGKIQEFLAAKDDVLSFQEAANDILQIPYTLGWGVGHNPYHLPVIRGTLTQKIASRIPAILKQVVDTFSTIVPNSTDWHAVSLRDLLTATVVRVSNSVFIGYPLCQNKEYLDNAVAYTLSVVVSAELIKIFPKFLRPLVARFTPISRRRQIAYKFLAPIIKERLASIDEEGAWKNDRTQKPDDLLQWLIDVAPRDERSPMKLVERMMAANFGALHSTIMALTGAIYSLAKEPEKYLPELREEVQNSMKAGEISKADLSNLNKMDSFLKESARFNSTSLRVMRTAQKGFRFRDGTVIPPGAVVAAPAYALHNDADVYPNPETFDGFRFSNKSETGVSTLKRQVVRTATDYLPFGHGRHACPGRFFAATEMKLVLMHLVMNYDIKLLPGTAPRPMVFGTNIIPDSSLPVLFRKRGMVN